MTTEPSQVDDAALPPDAFQAALLESIAHLRDVSLRDGIQSWDGNKWPIANILPCVKELNKLAALVKKSGGTFPPVELWGGGQVSQPAKFLKEDPFINLEDIHTVGPDLDIQCLYRGRQCFGFEPVSVEVQKAAITAAADRGMKVFRVFDMMNDISNVIPGIEAIKEYRTTHPGKKDIKIEGAVSYISEPKKGPRVWSLQDYADYAVKLVENGCDEIAIKNYAGLGGWEMPELVRTIKKTLIEHNHPDIPINLHMHGAHADILHEAIKAGATKVDVACGELSDGPAHTNMMHVLERLMYERGFNPYSDNKRFKNHPIIKQIKEYERVIAEQLEKLPKLKEGRPPAIPQKDLEHYHMAGGSLSDVWARAVTAEPNLFKFCHDTYAKKYPSSGIKDISSRIEEESRQIKSDPKKFRENIYHQMLETCCVLWEKAGRFNTVTPGALINAEQAQQIVLNRKAGIPESMLDYADSYMNIVKGRYGYNKGADVLPHTKKFQNAVLVYTALRKFNELMESDAIDARSGGSILDALDSVINRKDFVIGINSARRPCIHLEDPELEGKLSEVNVEKFRGALQAAITNETTESPKKRLLEQMLAEATPGSFPTPTLGLDEGRKIVSAIETSQNINTTELSAIPQARISPPEALALMGMLLRQKSKKDPPDVILQNLVAAAIQRSQNPVPPSPGGRAGVVR